MAMQTRVMRRMGQYAPAKTTRRVPPASAVLRMTGKTATNIRSAHARCSVCACLLDLRSSGFSLMFFLIVLLPFSVPSAKTPSMALQSMDASATVSSTWTQSAASIPPPKQTAFTIQRFATCPGVALSSLLHSRSSQTWIFGSQLTLPLVRWRCMCPTRMTPSLWMWTSILGFTPSR